MKVWARYEKWKNWNFFFYILLQLSQNSSSESVDLYIQKIKQTLQKLVFITCKKLLINYIKLTFIPSLMMYRIWIWIWSIRKHADFIRKRDPRIVWYKRMQNLEWSTSHGIEFSSHRFIMRFDNPPFIYIYIYTHTHARAYSYHFASPFHIEYSVTGCSALVMFS